MDESLWGVVNILGPVIMLIVLVWLVMRSRSRRNDGDNQRSEQGTRDLYAAEEQRRREGTDDL